MPLNFDQGEEIMIVLSEGEAEAENHRVNGDGEADQSVLVRNARQLSSM